MAVARVLAACDLAAAAAFVLSSAAFGHVGAGGSLGFADPVAGFSFGYTMNKMGPGLLMNERSQPLVDAAYLSLGYRNKDGGVWVKDETGNVSGSSGSTTGNAATATSAACGI